MKNDLTTQGQSGSNDGLTLQRKLGMREAVTIAVGLVVGVGIFTVGAAGAGILTGGSILIATFISFLFTIYPCMMYGEMGGAMPYAGGTYNYACRAFNKPVASIAAWHYIVAIVATAAGESLAFANYFAWFFKGFGIDFTLDVRIVAAILMIFFAYINFRGVEISGKVQNAFVFFFWGATLVWMLIMFKDGSFANFVPEAFKHMPAFKEFMMVVTWVWWCFAGFETAVGMGGEIKYPQINIPRSLVIVPFIILAVNGLLQWFLVALVPYSLHPMLASAAAPFAEGLTAAGYVGLPIILLCAALAFGGDLSTMNPGVAGPARYIYQMGQDGVLPRFFGKIHPKYKTPYVAVIATALMIFLLILTNSIVWIATLSMCSLFWLYIIGFLSFYVLRKKEPNLTRQFKVKGATLAVISSIIFYLIMMWSLGWYNIGLSFTITGAALLYYVAWARTHSITDAELRQRMEAESATLVDDIPSPEEKRKMDREYKTWLTVAIVISGVTLLLYIIAFLA